MTKKKWLSIVTIVLVFGIAFGMSYLASSSLRVSQEDAKKAVTGASAVKAADIQDENGKFVILDYPEDLDLSGYVELCDYHSMQVQTVEKPEITEADIEANIDSYLFYQDKYIQITDRPIAEGDILTMAYTGYQDGKAVDAYTTENVRFALGSGGEPEEFAEHLVGTSVGEEQVFDVTFPDDWTDSVYAGVTLTFHVTVSAINELPDVTEENVSELTDDQFDTLDAFRTYIREQIEAYDTEQYESTLSNEIMDKMLEESTFKTVPQELVNWHVSTQMRYYQDQADQYQMTVEEYLQEAGLPDDIDDVLYEMTEVAVASLKRYAVLDAVADAEGITVDEEADAAYLEKRSSQLIEGLGLSGEDALESYYHTSNLLHDVQNWKVLDWLMENIQQADLEVVAEE